MKKVVLIIMLMLIQQIFAQNDNENQTDKDNNKRAISYQSQIKNSEGLPIEDGKYKVVFNLYDSEKEEKPVWFETQQLEIKDGILNALIGSQKKLQAEDFKDQLWLTIEINDEESEKQFISASSYSLFTSRIDRDAFVAGEGIILAQRPDGRLEIAVKEIYPINGETINTFHVNHLDMKYSENNFDYFHIRNKSATPVGTVMYNKKSAWYGGNLESDGNYDDFVIYARDGRDLVLKSDQNNGSVFVGGETCPNNLFITGGLTVQATTKLTNRDFLTGGTNNWQFSTPDDGRQDMYITNRMHSSASDWSKQTTFHENGNLTVNGDIIGRKDINLTGTLNATNVNSSGSDLTLKSDLTGGKVVIGTPETPNHLNVTGNLSISGKLNTSFYTDRDFFTGGTNNWQFHTPDDGRQDMFITNRMHSSASDWTKQTTFHENGNLTVNGKIYGKGDIEITEDIIGKKDINLTGTLNATNVNSNSLTVQGTTKLTNRDFMTGGTNNWQFSTPDDGRQDMYITNRMHSSASDWSKQTIFHENGDMTVNGNIIGKKDINLTGTLNATNVNSKINASLFKLANTMEEYDVLSFTDRDNKAVGSIMYNRTAPWYGGKAVEGIYDDFVIYAREGRDLVLKCDAKDNVHGEVYVGSAGHTNNLRVTGTIFATEIQVKLDVFPDYVFKKDYNLLSLTEVENHINSHGTLPGMPTEKEIVENGLNINQMQIKLVEKIEELTLHMIRLEKENSDLRARMDSINR